MFRHAMTQVNKDAKAEIKPYADKFYEWITTMYAMLPVHDWDYSLQDARELIDYMNDNKYIIFSSRYPTRQQHQRRDRVVQEHHA